MTTFAKPQNLLFFSAVQLYTAKCTVTTAQCTASTAQQYTEVIVLYPYYDNKRDVRSNILLRLKEFPRAKLGGNIERVKSQYSIF